MVEVHSPAMVLLEWLGRTTWQAAVLAGLVWVVLRLGRRWLTPAWRHGLWLLVVVRLALPVVPGSGWSLFHWATPRWPVGQPGRMAMAEQEPSAGVEGRGGGEAEATQAIGVETAWVGERPPTVPKPAAVDRSWPAGGSRADVREMAKGWDSWASYGAVIWGLGVAIQGSRLVGREWGFRRRLRRDWTPAPERVAGLVRECLGVLGVRWNVRVRETAEVGSPAVCGFWEPVVLLPRGLAEGFTDAELRHVLMHELAHVLRWDHVVHGFVAMLGIVHWFNPVAWFVFRQVCIERELATDARVLSATGESEARAYGGTILRVLEMLARVPSAPARLGILEDRGLVRERIRMIAGFRRPSGWSRWGLIPVVGLALVALTDAPAREERQVEMVAQPLPAIGGGRLERVGDQVPAVKPGTRIAGRVLDAGGRPVSGAQVVIRGPAAENGESGSEGPKLDTVTTDGEGRWMTDKIPGVPVRLRFSVRHPDHLVTDIGQAMSTATEVGAPTAEALLAGRAELRVQPPIEVRGVVEVPGGRPAAGAEVVAAWGQAPGNRRSVRTGMTGEFVVPVTEVGLVRLLAMAEGWGPTRMELVAEQRLRPVTISLAEGRRLRGRVLDPQGRGVAGVRVSYRVWPQDALPAWSVESDGEGRFVWGGAPVGEFTVRAERDGFGWADQVVAVGDGQDGREVELRLFPGFVVEGVAVDARSRARVGEVAVQCGWTENPDEPCTFWRPLETQRTAEGGFRVTLPRGQWGNRAMWVQLAASAPGYQPVLSRLYEPGEERASVVFELRESKPWEGRVVGVEGRPIAGAQVAVLTGMEGSFFSLQANLVQVPSGGELMVTTDGDGRFKLPPTASTVRFVAVHPEHGYAEVAGEALGRDGRIVLQPWGRIEGVLRVGAGLGLDEDVELASNREWPEAQLRFDFQRYRARTDGKDGTFVLERVPPGNRKLVRVIRGAEQFWQQSHALEVRVEPGRTTRVTWGGGGRVVTGRFVAADGARPVEWQRSIVSLSTWLPVLEQGSAEEVGAWKRSKKGQEVLRAARNYAVRVAADGSFRAEDVPPGEYRLTGSLFRASEQPGNDTRPLAYRPARVTVPSARWRWRGESQGIEVGEVKVDLGAAR